MDKLARCATTTDKFYFLEYVFIPDILLSQETVTMYEYFTNKQTLVDRRTYLAADCRYEQFRVGEAYIQNDRLYPSQL